MEYLAKGMSKSIVRGVLLERRADLLTIDFEGRGPKKVPVSVVLLVEGDRITLPNWFIKKLIPKVKQHTKIYFDYFELSDPDEAIDEIIGIKAVDVHHINSRGMGGSKQADIIENLMAVARVSHDLFGDKKCYVGFLKKVHNHFIETRRPYILDYPNAPELKRYPAPYSDLIIKAKAQ